MVLSSFRSFHVLVTITFVQEKTVFALHVCSSARIYAILSFNKAEIDSPFG